MATVNFPEAAGAVNVYPIGVLKNAAQATTAMFTVTSHPVSTTQTATITATYR